MYKLKYKACIIRPLKLKQYHERLAFTHQGGVAFIPTRSGAKARRRQSYNRIYETYAPEKLLCSRTTTAYQISDITQINTTAIVQYSHNGISTGTDLHFSFLWHFILTLLDLYWCNLHSSTFHQALGGSGFQLITMGHSKTNMLKYLNLTMEQRSLEFVSGNMKAMS